MKDVEVIVRVYEMELELLARTLRRFDRKNAAIRKNFMEIIDRENGGRYTIYEILADNRKLITRRRYVSQRAIFKKDYFKEG